MLCCSWKIVVLVAIIAFKLFWLVYGDLGSMGFALSVRHLIVAGTTLQKLMMSTSQSLDNYFFSRPLP